MYFTEVGERGGTDTRDLKHNEMVERTSASHAGGLATQAVLRWEMLEMAMRYVNMWPR